MAILGTLSLDLSAPTAQLSRDLDRAQQMAREAASKMGGIKPVWGIASSLQDEMRASRSILNSSLRAIESDTKGYRPMVRVGLESDSGAIDTRTQSLDKEFSHQLAYLNRQVITPQVDDNQLTALNKHLSLKERHLDAVVAKFTNTRITPSVDDQQLKTLSDLLDRVASKNGGKIQIENNAPQGGGVAKGVLSPVASIFRGGFEGLGRNLFGGVSKSFTAAIDAALANTIGSTDLLGRKLGEKLVSKVQQVGYQIAGENPAIGATISSIQKEVRSSIGEKDVAIEANKSRGKQAKQKQKDLELAREGVTEERKSAREGVRNAEREAVKTYQDLKPLQDEIDKREAPERTKLAKIADIRYNYPNLSPRSQAKIRVIEAKIASRREEYQPAIDLVDGRIESAQAKLAMARDRSKSADAHAKLLKRQQQPKVYQDILDEISPNLPDRLVPKLVSNPNAKADGEYGRYNVVENQVYLDPQIYDKIQSGKKLSKTEYKTLREEVEHANDLKFGQFEGYQSLSERRLIDKPVKATAKEEAAVGLELVGYDDDVKPFERNAKIKTNRAASRYASQSQLDNINQFVGDGGRKFSRKALDGIKKAESGLDLTREVADAKGVELGSISKLETTLNKLKLEQLRLVDEIQKGQSGGLNPKQIEKLETDLISQSEQISTVRGRIKNTGRTVARLANNETYQSKVRARKSFNNNRGSFDDSTSLSNIGSKPVSIFNPPDIDPSVDPWDGEKLTLQPSKLAIRPKVDIQAVNIPEPEYIEALKEPGKIQQFAAEIYDKSSPIVFSAAKSGVSSLSKSAGTAIQTTAGQAGKLYRGVERIEGFTHQLIPGAGQAKSIITNVVAPLGLATAAAHNPVVGGAITGLLDLASGGMGGIGHGLVDAATNLMPWGLKGAASSIGGGVVDLVSTYAPALFGGKFALNTGKEVLKGIFPGFNKKPDQQKQQYAKELDLSEIEEMKTSIRREIQALQNFKAIIEPEPPKITKEQDASAQQIIADYDREQEQKLSQKFDALQTPSKSKKKANTSQPSQNISENIGSADIQDTSDIGKKVAAIKKTIEKNRKSIQSKLDSGNPEQIAQGLSEAAQFGYGLQVLKEDLYSAYSKVDAAKIANPENKSAIELSRKKIKGSIDSIEGGSQTKIIREKIAKIESNQSLVAEIDRFIPTGGDGGVLEQAKNALNPQQKKSKPNENPDDLESLSKKRFFGLFGSSDEDNDREYNIEINSLIKKRERLRAKIKSARQPQEYFKKVAKSQPELGSSNEENAIYDRTRSEAFAASVDAQEEARLDGISLREINKQIRAINKVISPTAPTPDIKPASKSNRIAPVAPVARINPIQQDIKPELPPNPKPDPKPKPKPKPKPVISTVQPDVENLGSDSRLIEPTPVLKFTLADVRKLPPLPKPLPPLPTPVPTTPVPPVNSDTDTTPSTTDESPEFKYGIFDRLRANSPFRSRRNRKKYSNNSQNPEGAGFEAIGRARGAQDEFDRAERLIQNRESKILQKNLAFNGIEKAYDPIKNAVRGVGEGFGRLVGYGKLALGTFGAFTALSLGVPSMISLGKSTLDTAKSFETLQVKLAAASDSAQAGKNSFKRITGIADNLGISRSGALEVGAGIAGTTFGTELEGKPSDRLTDQTLEFFKLRGLSKQQQEGFQLAATQTLGRKNVSMQEVNQFIQSAGITDTRSIAARGLGMTPAQFASAADTTGIDAKKFYSAFISQGLQDSRTSEGLASQTSQYKESKLSANNEKLAATVGDAAMPVYKAGIDLLTNSIGLLVSALENGKSMLIGFATYGLIFAGVELFKLVGNFELFNKALVVSKMLTLSSVGTIATSVVKLGATLAAFYIIGEGIQALGKKWSNAGQEIQDGADKVANALSKLNKNQPPNPNNPSTAALAWGDNPVENAGLYFQRGLGIPISESLQKTGLIGKDTEILDNKQKADREIVIAGQNVTTQVLEARFAGNQVKKKGISMENVDRELAAIDTERSGLYSSGAPDASKIAALNKRYREKTKERDTSNEEVAPLKTAAQEAINAVKGQQAFLDKNRGKIGEDTYLSQSAQAAKDLKIAEETLLRINKDLKSSFDTLSKWVNTLDKISAKFEKIGTQSNTSRQLFATNRNLGEIGGRLTRGGSERQSVYDNDRITSEEIKQRKLVIRELKDSLNILDKDNVSRVQTSYDLNENSSVSEINVAKNRATDDKDKTTLEKLATIKEEQLKVATLDAGLSNSHKETYQRIYQENREAALYYTSLSQQIDPKGVMFAKNISTITAEKARFMAKLQNYGTGGFDVYTTAIIDLMDLAKDRMTALAKLAADKKAAIDAQTNRNNDIAGKRQNDFDVTPGTQQSSTGNAPQPLAPVNPTQQQPAQPKPKSNPNGFLGAGKTRQQVNSALSKLTPDQRKRYLTTSMSVDGKTDLGLDEFDRKILGLNDRGKPQGIPISTVDGRQLRSPFSAIDSKPFAGTNQVTPQTSGGRLTTGQFRDKSRVASDRITQEALDRSNATFSEFEPGQALKQNQIRLKLDRESRLAKQAAAKQLRDQQSTQLNAVPAISIQDTQQRETLSQRNALTDNRDSVSNARIDMKSQIQNIEISIAEFNQLSQKKNRTQGENAVLEQLKIAVPKLSKDLPILRQALGRLQASEAGLPANDANAIAALQEQQTYNLGKQKETEEQDRRATENTQLRGKLTDVDQQLTNTPLDQDKLKNQRELNKQIVIRDAEIIRINAERAITDRSRSDASYYPKQQASDRAKVKLIEQNTIKNAKNKQVQESVRAANAINQEFATADIAELKLGQSSGDLGVRFAQSQDKIDAPFANTRALDLELQQKLSATENAKVERNKQFEQQRIKYAGTSGANIKLLASLDRQQKEADRQSDIEKKVAETDSGIAIRGVQSQRKSYLYGQQKSAYSQALGIYDAQTTGDKQRGADTRDREYVGAVRRKQFEYSQQVFDLTQQRDAITGLTPEADAARSSIDGLIAGLKQMEAIELSNMANQFDRFNQVLGETQKTTQSVLDKFVKTGKFDWKSILRTPLEGGISQLMNQVTGSLFGGLYRKSPVTNTPALPDGTKPTDSANSGIGFIGNMIGLGGQTASNLQPTLQPQPALPQPAPSAKIERAVDQIISQPAQSAIAPLTSRSILDVDGMANIPMPGGGNYRIPREQAISEGFMRLDGSSTSAPEVKPEIKIAPLEPQTIAAPEVTIEPIAPQTIPSPAPDDGTRFDIRPLPMPGRNNITNFKPKFDPNAGIVVAPPMPVNEFEGMPGYTVPKQQQRSSSGDAMGLLSMIPGLGSAGKYMGMLGKIGGLFGLSFADGGMVPIDSKFGEFRQGNDPIARALQKEGQNSVIAALTPGERVLTVSESRYYETMFPQGIKGYADGGVVGNIKPIPLNLNQSKIDNRGDSNEFNFDIKNGGGGENARMTKENLKEMENAVVAVLLKQKRARTGLVPM